MKTEEEGTRGCCVALEAAACEGKAEIYFDRTGYPVQKTCPDDVFHKRVSHLRVATSRAADMGFRPRGFSPNAHRTCLHG